MTGTGYEHDTAVTHRLSQAAKATRTRLAAHLRNHGIHAGQEHVLKVLSQNESMSMGELARALSVQPPTITKMVARMMSHGLLIKSTSNNDGRMSRVQLTERGAASLAGIDEALSRTEDEALDGLEPKERRKLVKLLQKVEDNLSRDSKAAATAAGSGASENVA